MNDRELLQQFVRDRSEPAFRELVQRHTNWLYSACLRRLRDPALAEDAAQAVFLALAQKAPTLLHEPTLSPWLHRAAKFVAANILRAQARRARHESEAAAMTPTSTLPREWQTLEPDLEPALDRLPFADRQIILLRFYEQKSNPEIATALAISEPAAAKRLSRALERLRTLLPQKAALSATTLASLLLSHTVTLAPTHLAAAAAVSTTTAALAKGALTAMALAKLQTAALIIAAACLLIAIPTTVIVLQHNPSPAPEPLAATTSTSTSPNPFAQAYGLAPGQFVRLVTDGPPELRAEFMQVAHFRQDSPSAGTIFVGWDNGSTRSGGHITFKRYSLATLATYILNTQPFNIEGDLANYMITGDFSFDQTPTVTLDQRAADLQKILNEQLHIPAHIQFRDVSRRVLILRGKWKYTPDANAPITNTAKAPDGSPLPSINFYNTETFGENSRQSGIGAGSSSEITAELGIWLNQPVFLEADNVPSSLGLRFFNPNKDPFDRNLLLKHFSEQTGLTWTEETRTFRHLFIESTTAPDDFLAYYSLQPDESLKIVTDVPSEARAAFLAQGDPTRRPPPPGKFITIRWDNGQAYLWGYGDSVPLLDILEVDLGFYPQTLDLHLPNNAALPDFKGDLILRANATPEQYRASLQMALSKSLNAPINVSFRDVTEKAIVLRGDWHYTPNQPHARSEIRGLPDLEIYGPHTDSNMDTGIIANGNREYFAGHLGDWIHQPVLIESDSFPSAVSAHFNTDNPNDPQSHDKTLILNLLTAQTNLTWSEETRTIRHLVIESAPAAP